MLKVPEVYNQTFEPVFNPAIGAAAIAAAIPPIIFWVRVVAAEQRRQKEAEDKERAREVRRYLVDWMAVQRSDQGNCYNTVHKRLLVQELKRKLFGK